MNRRNFIQMLLAGVGMLALRAPLAVAAEKEGAVTKLTHSDAEWKAILAPETYGVLRKEDTERPFTSPLNAEHREGTFACAGCKLELFPSRFKFDSGTGWPSFFDVIPGRIETKSDYALLMKRVEYHCARCGGHQGHVFEDGPAPTGLRYCNNGVALIFTPKV